MVSICEEGLLLGFGHPLLDITAQVELNFLAAHNLQPNNVVLGGDDYERLVAEVTQKYGVQYTAGGSTQNTIRYGQWVLGTAKATAFLGCVGDDQFGQILRRKAQEDGVDVHYVVDESKPTGTCLCLVSGNGQNRSLLSFPGAARSFNRKHVLAEWPAVKRAKVFYCAGFSLLANREVVVELASYASEANKTFAINISANYVAEKMRGELVALMPMVDIVFGNDQEFRTLAKALGWKVSCVIFTCTSTLLN